GTVRLWDATNGHDLGVAVGGAQGRWLACRGSRCWRADDGSLLVKRNDHNAAIEPFPIRSAVGKPDIDPQFDPVVEHSKHKPPTIEITIRNAGQSTAFWIRATGISSCFENGSVLVLPSAPVQRLDRGQIANVTLRPAVNLHHWNPKPARVVVPL